MTKQPKDYIDPELPDSRPPGGVAPVDTRPVEKKKFPVGLIALGVLIAAVVLGNIVFA